jgi:hypothetical protein
MVNNLRTLGKSFAKDCRSGMERLGRYWQFCVNVSQLQIRIMFSLGQMSAQNASVTAYIVTFVLEI